MDAPTAKTSEAPESTGVAAAAAKATNDGNNNTSNSTSEDFLIFGAHPSHLFDDIAITIDSLLTEEVSTLPLLPRTLTDQEQQQQQADGQKPHTGEEKLITKLRKAYKKNIDTAEAYCSRNIFTVQQYSKTKRRKILENYLAQEQDNDSDKNESEGLAEKNDSTKTKDDEITPMPTASSKLSPIDGELPTPNEIISMDKEILMTRQRIQHAKQRRIQLVRQLERLNKASSTLLGVKDALQKHGLGGGEGNDVVNEVKESVSAAMEGHKELQVWNTRAEEVIDILDKIKVERDEQGGSSIMKSKAAGAGIAGGNGNKKTLVTGREADERERKRMLEEINSVSGDSQQKQRHGTKEEVDSLLKKLRGN